MFSKDKHALLGLDIGSTAIKLVEISRHGQDYRLEACAIEPLPRGAVVDKLVREPQAVAAALRRAVRSSGTRLKRAAAAIGGGTAITKLITMPTGLDELELEEQIAVEANQYLSYPINEVNLDFEVMGPTPDGERVEVLLAASRSELVEDWSLAIQMAGLQLKILDIEAFALENAWPLYSRQLPEQGVYQTAAVIDVGHSTTTITVLKDGEGIFEQTQSFGCGQLVDSLVKQSGMEESQVMTHLQQGSLPEPQRSDLLLPYVDTVIRHISRMMQLFQSSPHATELDHILLCGGGAMLPALAEGVSGRLGINAALAQPLEGMSLSSRINRTALRRSAPRLVIALGLALRGFEP
ncbi:MAG: type IV pilus assembly protein PilM [Gammaproteobacteria bacterium]|nr:type IV pilus assembly protein PilM [Gammaproteobacteria bacterium]